jgi:hypothetical protein
VCQVFPLWEVVLCPALVCVTRVRKSGVFLLLLLSILSIMSTFFPSFHLGLHCVCPSTVLPAFRTTTLYSCCVNFVYCVCPSTVLAAFRTTTLYSCCVNFVICTVNFLYFRARYFGVILVFFGGPCSEPTLWNTGAGFLFSCRRVIFSFVLKILPVRSF